MDTLHDIGLQKNNIGYKLSEVRYMENYIRYRTARAHDVQESFGEWGAVCRLFVNFAGQSNT